MKLNDELSDVLNRRDNDISSLRGIMRKQNHLHDICVKLNESYGMPMLFATSLVFLDSIMSAKDFFETILIIDRLCCPFWIMSHVVPSFWVMRICQQAEDVVSKKRFHIQVKNPVKLSQGIYGWKLLGRLGLPLCQ